MRQNVGENAHRQRPQGQETFPLADSGADNEAAGRDDISL